MNLSGFSAPTLVITSRDVAEEIAASPHDFTHCISIHQDPLTFESSENVGELPIKVAHKLGLKFDDIARKRPGWKEPTREHIQEILDFAKTVTKDSKVLVHCAAGVSRSTAAAYIMLCAMNEPGSERFAMEHVFEVRPVAHPNELMVKTADDLLQRKGAMLRYAWRS